MKDGRALGTVNDKYLQNIGYCRLKNLTFGYSIPEKVLRKAKISQLRVYFSGENLAYAHVALCKIVDSHIGENGIDSDLGALCSLGLGDQLFDGLVGVQSGEESLALVHSHIKGQNTILSL